MNAPRDAAHPAPTPGRRPPGGAVLRGWVRTAVVAVGLGATVPAVAVSPVVDGHGFRGDGSSRFGGEPPTAWTGADADGSVTWKTALPSWSNASPVSWGDQVCTTAEPTTVVCVDAATGAVRWQTTNDYGDALQGEARAAWQTMQAQVEAKREAFREARSRYSALRRELRRAEVGDGVMAELEAVSAELESLRAFLDEATATATPPDKEIIGYASATPWVDGDALYAVFGNGVVSRFAPDGTRVWSRHLEAPPAKMRGYHIGTSASPQVVDGVLVVPFGHLYGLDPATGETRWTGPRYHDFGTPGVGRVGDVPVLVTPEGQVVDARSGAVLATGLGDLWFIGPLVEGDEVWFVGGLGDAQLAQRGHVPARKWRLVPDGSGGVDPQPVWDVELPGVGAFFTSPIRVGDTLFSVDRHGALYALDDATGAVRFKETVGGPGVGTHYGSPSLSGGHLYIPGEEGVVRVMPASVPFDAGAVHRAETLRSVPTPVEDTLYLRGMTSLWRIDKAP